MMRTLFFLLLFVIFPAPLRAAEGGAMLPMHCRIDAAVDIADSRISGTLTIPVRAGEEIGLETGTLTVQGVFLDGKPLDAAARDGKLAVRPAKTGLLAVRYEGVFRGGESLGEHNYGVVSSTIDKRGISLTGLWHPRPDHLATWTLRVTLPEGYEAVSEADRVEKKTAEGTVEFLFEFPHPVASLTLVASDRYVVSRERFGDRELLAYFFPEDRELAKTYLQHARNYIEMYERMLGPYPYERFAVVENFLPTGYSLPTFTLLGQEVVRLPFIVETSLGHEILHQWFGNSVYCDDRGGNWTEGLTTYLADQWYEEQKGKGWEYRKQLLVNYAAYVHAKDEFPLRDFRSRTDLASRSIGYGKAAMVFHMLRRRMGDDRFFAALREFVREQRFRAASWQDLESVFNKHAEKDLTSFFRAWLDGTGLPVVSVENLSVRRDGDGFEIAFDAVRKGLSIPLELPVLVTFLDGGSTERSVTVDEDRKHCSLIVSKEPAEAVFDGNYDIARRPVADELPPVIALLVGEEHPLIVLPPSGRERYRSVFAAFARDGVTEKDARDVKDAEIRASSLVVLGRDNPLLDRLFGGPVKAGGGFSVMVRKDPLNDEKVIGVIDAGSAEEADAAVQKIFHYGKYSVISFDKGKNMEKRIDASDRGIIWELRQEPAVVDMGLVRKLNAALEAAQSKRLVFVGEYHDRFSNHEVELRIIQGLHARYPNTAVGMEMFQRPFQKTLDEYIGGSIDEREFLKRSEYFKRWGFDYNLYKPILDYCRQERIPVIALNLREEITDKVSKEGMDSLTAEERKELPKEMDFSNEAYRVRIRQAFDEHRGPEKPSFDHFLQAQVLWDETMAESAANYLAANPARQLIVLAGGGHVVYGDGIPQRTFRRNGLPYTIILNDGDIDPGIADFVVLPEALDGMTAPKLQVLFRVDGGRLIINGFADDSPARKAGLRTGDRVTALDGTPVGGLGDVRLALFFKKPGDTIRVTVERKRFFFGTRVLTVDVVL